MVDESRARPGRAQPVQLQSGSELRPVQQIGAHRVSPIHEAHIGRQPEWISLPEEVVLSPIEDRAVHIVVPSALDGEMELRPVALPV